jgi:hypothetical protein
VLNDWISKRVRNGDFAIWQLDELWFDQSESVLSGNRASRG